MEVKAIPPEADEAMVEVAVMPAGAAIAASPAEESTTLGILTISENALADAPTRDNVIDGR